MTYTRCPNVLPTGFLEKNIGFVWTPDDARLSAENARSLGTIKYMTQTRDMCAALSK